MAANLNLKNPLLWVSVALGALGALQAGLGTMTELISEYPRLFGLGVVFISAITGGLTQAKVVLTGVPAPKP
jgi:hypothetical protein